MITGFNTDVQRDGVTYHVQTEDKGLDTPLILSLVYVGGAIIASKRTPYADLISKGFDEQTLTERLQRQHKLICAAIKAGRVDELKQMSGQAGGAAQPKPEVQKSGAASGGKKVGGQRKKKSDAPAPPVKEAAEPPVEEAAQPVKEAVPPPAETAPAAAEPAALNGKQSEPDIVILTTLAEELGALDLYRPDPVTKPLAPLGTMPLVAPGVEAPDRPEVAQEAAEPIPVEPLLEAEIVEEPEDPSDEIHLSLLDDEGEFRAGQLVTIKIYVGRGTYGQRPVREASLTVKVLGTSFRPLIVTSETDEHGVGIVRALLPRFNSGRAAIIIRAVSGDDSVEMRRIIHQ